MPISNTTPIRQLVRMYSALLGIKDALTKVPDAMARIEQAVHELKDAVSRPDLVERLVSLESKLTTVDSRYALLQTEFDARAAKVIRDHLFLPQPSHWSAQKPFLPFSTCSAADFLHVRYAEICRVLGHRLQFHRKLWEWVFIFHHLEQAGMLSEGKRGLGFGVGKERLPAVFASRGASVIATDAPAEIGASSGWTDTGQHSDNLAELRFPELVSDELFDARVSHRFVDMNEISDDLIDFDFAWSACAFEHLGSLEAGMQFVINSVEKTLKPGGMAVHTSEFNLSSNDATIADGHTVLYRRRDMEELMARLRERGHEVAPFVVAPDSHFLDFYVDLPPYADEPSLKIKFGEFVTTSVGLVITKAT